MTLQKENKMQIALAVIDEEQSEKFVKEAVKCGCRGGFIAPARGLVTSELLNSLSLRERKRRIVLLIETIDILSPTLEHLNKTFKLDQPNHGILFTMNINHALYPLANHIPDFTHFSSPYQLILALFRHERRQTIVDIIQNHKARGGTIFTGKGGFVKEQTSFLGLHSSPQKDVLLSVVIKDIVANIFQSIDQTFDISQSKGMMLQSLDVLAFSKAPQAHTFLSDEAPELSVLFMVMDAPLLETYRECIRKHGWRGGTAMKASGTFNPDYIEHAFNMPINPEKRIVFTIDQTSHIQTLYQALFDDPKIDPSQHSVSFVVGVENSYGVRHT